MFREIRGDKEANSLEQLNMNDVINNVICFTELALFECKKYCDCITDIIPRILINNV